MPDRDDEMDHWLYHVITPRIETLLSLDPCLDATGIGAKCAKCGRHDVERVHIVRGESGRQFYCPT